MTQTRFALSLLFAFAALVAFHVLGTWWLPLIDRDEPRFAEASREMMQRGDWIVPYFNNHPRYDKPALIYWTQVAAYRGFGVNEFAARFPSAVFAALTALVLVIWMRRAGSEANGWRAALIFSLCLQTAIHARSAVADMPMICFVAMAAWFGWEWLVRNDPLQQARGVRWGWAAAFWVALALGFLAKGPIAWIPIGMAVWLLRHARTESRPTAWEWVGGVVLMFAVIAIWGVPALIQTHGEFFTIGFRKHVVDRSLSTQEGHGLHGIGGYFLMLPLYFVTIWYGFFPWSIWLPRAARDFWVRKRFLDPLDGYLAVGVALVFGIFTLISTKLPHYTLPAFPFLALLMARWWEQGSSRLGSFRTAAISMAVGLAVLTLVVIPMSVRFFVAETLYREAEPFLSEQMEMATLDYEEASLIWTFRRRIGGFQTSLKAPALAEWMARPGPRLCIGLKDSIDKSLPKQPEWRSFEAEGMQLAKGKPVRLEAVIKEK